MTDEKLALLEHVAYIDKNLLEKVEIYDDLLELRENDTLKQILDVFDEKKLKKLKEIDDEIILGALITGKEWADIIETIQNDPELSQLIVRDHFEYETAKNKKVNLNISYKDPRTGECIVTFKGTSGRREWEDNVRGLYLEETPCQLEALDFFDKQAKDFDKLTVVGHSKGANKAMFVTIASQFADKITKCVAIDGQGFSNEFLNKYADKIQERAEKITNFFACSDFVNILMKQVDKSSQVPCQEYEMTKTLQAHSPNTIFEREQNGKLLLKDNSPNFVPLDDRTECMKIIQGFVSYTMDHRSQKQLQKIGEYLAPIVGELLGADSKEHDVFFNIKRAIRVPSLVFGEPSALVDIAKVLHSYSKEEDLSLGQLLSVPKHFISKKQIPDINVEREVSKEQEQKNCSVPSLGDNLQEYGAYLKTNGKTKELRLLGEYIASGGNMSIINLDKDVSQEFLERLQEEQISYLVLDSNEKKETVMVPIQDDSKLKEIENEFDFDSHIRSEEIGPHSKYVSYKQNKAYDTEKSKIIPVAARSKKEMDVEIER